MDSLDFRRSRVKIEYFQVGPHVPGIRGAGQRHDAGIQR
jgi:hypothetical protein